MHAQLLQACPTLCNLMDCSLPSSPVHGILQARILEYTAMPSSGRSSQPRDRTHASCLLRGQAGSLLVPPGKPIDPLPGASFTKCFTYICFSLKAGWDLSHYTELLSCTQQSFPYPEYVFQDLQWMPETVGILGMLCFPYVYIPTIRLNL